MLLMFPAALNSQSGNYNGFYYSGANGQISITGYIGSGRGVIIPSKINGLPVTKIGHRESSGQIYSAFYRSGLTDLTIPDSVTCIDNNAFSNCDKLASVTIPKSVTTIGVWAFSGCTSLKTFTIPKGVSDIRTPLFLGCYALASISVDSENSDYSSLDGVLFNKTKTVLLEYPAGKPDRSYTIPSSVTKIEDSAFEHCRNLTTVTIPDSVTNLNQNTFSYCENLSHVSVPSSLGDIRNGVFNGCSKQLIVTTYQSEKKRIAEINQDRKTTNAQPIEALYTMRYRVSGRCVLDAKDWSKRIPGPAGMSIAQQFFQANGVVFPPGSVAEFKDTTLVITTTKPSLELVEILVDQSNSQNGLSPSINKHFKDLNPRPTVVTANPAQDTSDKSIPKPNTPPIVVSNQAVISNNPIFNGIPLSEILCNAVVATSRSPIYELSGGDQSFRDTLEHIKAKYTRSNDSYPAYLERLNALQALAKDALPGRLLGYLRPEFIVKSMNWQSTDSAPVLFPKTIGGMQFGAVHWSDFTTVKVVPHDLNATFKPYPLTTKSLLFDPFDALDPILSNTESTMITAWIISDKTGQNTIVCNGAILSVVETRDGLFLGYLGEKGESGMSAITWEQTTRTTHTPFTLKTVSSKDLKPSAVIFSLFDANARTQKRIPSDNPLDFVLFPENYGDVLQKGTWALKTSIAIPKDSGFSPVEEYETKTTFQLEIEKKLNWIRLQFDGLESDKLRLLVVSDYEFREVDRTRNANGGETINAKPWRQERQQLRADVSLLGDGSMRFTDGEKIYQIAIDRMKKPMLTVYTVEKNQLKR
jgi:hypothetical protein